MFEFLLNGGNGLYKGFEEWTKVLGVDVANKLLLTDIPQTVVLSIDQHIMKECKRTAEMRLVRS